MYILKNKKKINQYKQSNIDNLLKQFEKVILETLCFYERKRRTDTIKFLENSYSEILEVYNIVKITLKDENVVKVKKAEKEKEPLKEKIDEEGFSKINEIKENFNKCQQLIKSNVDSIYDEYSFNIMVEKNKGLIDELVSGTNNISWEFDNYLKQKYDEIINELELEQLEKDKKEFKEKMEGLNKINIQNVNKTFSKCTQTRYEKVIRTRMKTITKKEPYIYTETEKQSGFLKYLTFGLYKYDVKVKKIGYKDVEEQVEEKYEDYDTYYVFDSTESRRRYLEDIKPFFDKEEIKSIDGINTNKESTKNNIDGIFEKFTEEINGFQKNFDEFENIVKDVEKFILSNTGIQ